MTHEVIDLTNDDEIKSAIQALKSNQIVSVEYFLGDEYTPNEELLKSFAESLKNNKSIQCIELFRFPTQSIKLFVDALKNNTSITSLSYSGNMLDEVEENKSYLFATLIENKSKLRSLALHSSYSKNSDAVEGVDEYGAIEIGKALRNNNTLSKLDLAGNKINRGAIAIGEALATNKSLKELNLEKNSISTSSMSTFIKSLQKNNTLIELNICLNNARFDIDLLNDNTSLKIDILKHPHKPDDYHKSDLGKYTDLWLENKFTYEEYQQITKRNPSKSIIEPDQDSSLISPNFENIYDKNNQFSSPRIDESNEWDFENPTIGMIIFAAFFPIVGWSYLIYLLIKIIADFLSSDKEEQRSSYGAMAKTEPGLDSPLFDENEKYDDLKPHLKVGLLDGTSIFLNVDFEDMTVGVLKETILKQLNRNKSLEEQIDFISLLSEGYLLEDRQYLTKCNLSNGSVIWQQNPFAQIIQKVEKPNQRSIKTENSKLETQDIYKKANNSSELFFSPAKTNAPSNLSTINNDEGCTLF